MIAIGIDTGGTYTDAVAVELDTGKVLAKGKSPTTKENLALGIIAAINTLPSEFIDRADSVALSTTLATNACVENKGGRAKLLLLGTTEDVLRRIGADKEFGLNPESVLCIDTKGSYDGRYVDIPDWEKVFSENKEWLEDSEALSVAELYAFNNGAACEKSAKSALEGRLDVPIVTASDLVSELNIMERGATALLNARLLPVIKEFIEAVHCALDEKEQISRMVVVRSDSSLMSLALAEDRPVETILSGPAASTLGGMSLSGSRDCLIVDMGGTTTDISIIRDGIPKLAEKGIRIGGWSTQIKGVYVDTFALGGDSRVYIEKGELSLSNRRVLPVCFAAAKWPGIKSELSKLLSSKKTYHRDFHEFLYLAKEPAKLDRYTEWEQRLLDALQHGPRMIEHFMPAEGIDKYHLYSERLEAEGIVMRCGLTPTDMMHILGDYEGYDREASVLAARFFMNNLDEFKEREPEYFAEAVYDIVCEKLYTNILRVMLEDQYPKEFSKQLDPQSANLISYAWKQSRQGSMVNLGFDTPMTLVGVGAPTHMFLPRVAKTLRTQCIIPEHAEVANAVGAALADVRVHSRVDIRPILSAGIVVGYTVHAPEGAAIIRKLDEAKTFALNAAEAEAEREARKRGAKGELDIDTGIGSKQTTSADGVSVTYGIHAWAAASGSARFSQS